jgi:hypothetical protein
MTAETVFAKRQPIQPAHSAPIQMLARADLAPAGCTLYFFEIFWEAPLPDWVRECAVANRALGVKPGVKP